MQVMGDINEEYLDIFGYFVYSVTQDYNEVEGPNKKGIDVYFEPLMAPIAEIISQNYDSNSLLVC